MSVLPGSPPPASQTGSARPSRGIAVLTCMDSRLWLPDALGLRSGEAHILRNAGAMVTQDMLRSLAISQTVLGTTSIWIVTHTDCGSTKFEDEELLDRIEQSWGTRPDWRPGAYPDPVAAVGAAARSLRACPYLHTEDIRGFVYDVAVHAVNEVDCTPEELTR